MKNVVWTPPKPFGWDRKRLQATKTSPVDLRSTFATAWTIESLHGHVVVETWPQSPCPTLYTCGSSVTQARGGAAGLGGGGGAGFFLELHLTLSGWFIPGGAEAGNSGGWLRRTEMMSLVSESAQQFRVLRARRIRLQPGSRNSLSSSSPLPHPHTHWKQQTVFLVVFFFFAAAWCKHAAPFVR